MNKVVNIFSGVVLVVYFVFTMALIYDLSFSGFSLKGLPYKAEICGGFALVVLLLGFLRIKRRWQGANDMKSFKGFHFELEVAKPVINYALLFTIGEVIFMAGAIFFLVNLAKVNPEYVTIMAVVLFVLMIESIFFVFKIAKGGSSFRLGIDKKVVAYYDREMHLYYFTGLIRIEMHQDMVNFQYKEDLNIFLPLEAIRKEDWVPFRDALIETLENLPKTENGKNIYIDDAFRSLQ